MNGGAGVNMRINDGLNDGGSDDDAREGFKREMRYLEEMLSKLNPMAEEFVPPSLVAVNHHGLLPPAAGPFGYNATNNFVIHSNSGIPKGNSARRVVDCRVCGDPNSVLRFTFVEFTNEEGARNTLSLAGTMFGYYPVRVLPSKTSEDEREICARTIYCTNIDKKVTQAEVKLFFESICGEVYRLRLLGDYQHSTRIAFVEFVME